MVNVCEVFPGSNTIILDGVTFCVDFKTGVSIQDGHPMGPVFVCGAARAILKESDAKALIAAGVPKK